MPKKEINVALKRIPTKSEVKEATNKMTKAIAFSDREPLKNAKEVEQDTSREVLNSTITSTRKRPVFYVPTGKATVFEKILLNKDTTI